MKKILILIAGVIVVAGIILIVVVSLKKESTPSTSSKQASTQQPVTLTDGRQCYTYSHDATTDAPYATSEFMDITISGNKVLGTKTGTQAGPDMTNGYTGTITGTLADNKITDAYAYTIEGSKNTEYEIYQAGLTGIDKLRYPLIDKFKTGLFPDTSKSYTIEHYSRVECKGSN